MQRSKSFRNSLGDLSLKADWGVYKVSTKAKDIGDKTRGIKIKGKSAGKSEASDFHEESLKANMDLNCRQFVDGRNW